MSELIEIRSTETGYVRLIHPQAIVMFEPGRNDTTELTLSNGDIFEIDVALEAVRAWDSWPDVISGRALPPGTDEEKMLARKLGLSEHAPVSS